MTIDLTNERSTGVTVSVPGYEILDELGRGGHSVVYLARQTAVGRTVALKILAHLGAERDLSRRFHRECQALGLLSWHPGIVRVYDAGLTPDGTWYLAMEHLTGGSLSERLEGLGPRPWAEVLDVGVRVADALDAAHRAGLLHRDVKPGNVLVDCFGECKLADFGVVAVGGEPGTESGIVTGTVAHTAPEVLGGERASVASDVYSLGSTLYTLLAGSPAFVRDTDESFLPVALRAWTEPAPDLRGFGVPEAVAGAVAWTMAKDPASRPSSAAELAALLQECQAILGVEVSARRLAPLEAPFPSRSPAEATDPPGATPGTAAAPGTTTAASTTTRTGRTGRTGREPIGTGTRTRRVGPVERARPTSFSLPLGAALAAVGLGISAIVLSISTGSTIPSPAAATDARAAGASSAGPAVTLEPSERARSGDPSAVATGTPPVTPTAAVGAVATRAPGPSLLETVPVAGRPSALTSAGDNVWMAVADEGRLVTIDASTHETESSVAIGGAPGTVVATADAVWVSQPETETVARFDPLTHRVTDHIPVGRGGFGLAVVDGAVWVAQAGEGTVARIDPATRQVNRTIAVGTAPVGLVGAGGALWVIDRASDSLRRIDLGTGRAGRAVPVGPGPAAIVSSGDALWITNANGTTVSRYEMASQSVTDGIELGGRPTAIVVTRDSVWVTSVIAGADQPGSTVMPRRSQLSRIDLATSAVDTTIELPGSATGLAVSDLDAWVTAADDGALYRVTLPA